MKFLILILLSVLGANASNFDERPCGSDMSNLWLDIVIVVDTSANMAPGYLQYTSKTILDLFNNDTRIGTKYSDPRTTRVSLITYNKDATVVADLNKYQSFSDLSNGVKFSLTSTSIPVSYLSMGLSKADDVLTAGRSNNYRNNYNQLVIVFGAKNQRTPDGTDPSDIADKLQNKGVQIAVVDFTTDDSLVFVTTSMRNLYTPIRNNMPNFLVRQVLQANCFCPQNYVKYQPYDGANFGTCLQVPHMRKSWAQAKLTCQTNAKNGFLATEYTVNKHNFNKKLVSGLSAQTYHVGLSFLNGQWYWEQPAGQQLVPFYQPSHETAFWKLSYPMSTTTNTAVANFYDSNGNTAWQNINPTTDANLFICEVIACDTDNYCA